MSRRAILAIVFALVVAGGTTYAIRGWIDAQRSSMAAAQPAPVEPQQTETRVLVAKKDLPAGLFLKPEHLRWQAWPEDGIVDAYVRSDQRELGEFVGAVVRRGIAAGEPVTDVRVVKPGERGFLAAVLTPGMRAISVPVNAVAGIAGFVFPGDRIDLVLTHTTKKGPNAEGRRVSETVLSDLRVLAVDQKTDDQNGQPALAKTVTLEVTPKQVEMISVAAEMGRLALALRSLAPEEAKQRKRRGMTMDTEVSLALPTDSRAGPKVVVVRGGKVEEVPVRGGRQ